MLSSLYYFTVYIVCIIESHAHLLTSPNKQKYGTLCKTKTKHFNIILNWSSVNVWSLFSVPTFLESLSWCQMVAPLGPWLFVTTGHNCLCIICASFHDLVDDEDNVDFVQLSNCYSVCSIYFASDLFLFFFNQCLPSYSWPSWRWNPCQWSHLQGLFLF